MCVCVEWGAPASHPAVKMALLLPLKPQVLCPGPRSAGGTTLRRRVTTKRTERVLAELLVGEVAL